MIFWLQKNKLNTGNQKFGGGAGGGEKNPPPPFFWGPFTGNADSSIRIKLNKGRTVTKHRSLNKFLPKGKIW